MSKTSLSSLLFGLLLIIAVSNVSAKIKQRIIGGSRANYGDLKYQVSLQFLTTSGCTHHFCGGSILDEYHIITAAHCITEKNTHRLNNIPITVVAGTSQLHKKQSHPALYHAVDEVFIPTAWLQYPQKNLENDIAVLKLKDPLPLRSNPKISAIKLPQPNDYLPPNSVPVKISGFGSDYQTPVNGEYKSSPTSPILQWVWGWINQIDENFVCQSTQVCVQNGNGKNLGGSCYGDSGGPLVDPKTNILVGVVSVFNGVKINVTY
ncbi:mite allergen Der p 3-like [Trichogramma pretiosum]|uniref:mite allergen Der p 3-like n=1 Tax=Trichogramma pretiosum TaxID=7493 RepID=UPI0006C987CC|nr:mite allergen Der p 3-like [Trichogramma pretiosum]